MNRHELDELLLSKDVDQRLDKLNADGTLATLFPEVAVMVGFGGGDTGHKDLWGHTKQVVSQCVRRPLVRWAALFHDIGKPRCFRRDNAEVSFHGHEAVGAKLFLAIARRTKLFTEEEERHVHTLLLNLGYVESYDAAWTDSAVRRLYKETEAVFDDLVDLARADITTKHETKRRRHHERMHAFKERTLSLAQADAIPPALPKGLGDVLSEELGIPKSKQLGDLMNALKAAVERGELPRPPSVEAALNYARKLV